MQLELDIVDEAYTIKNLFVDFSLQRIISDLPSSLTLSFVNAINTCGIDMLKCSNCYVTKENTHIGNELLGEHSYQMLLSTEKDRIIYQNFNKTIYLNMAMPTEKVKSQSCFYVGIRGWNKFIKNVFGQIKTLEYINNSL
jgi:hypothetical protein